MRTLDRHSLIYRGLPPDLMCVDQYLRVLPDGDWAVFFTTGGATEPAAANYIAVSRSSDRGKTWSPIQPVAKYPDRAATLTEVLVHDGRISIFASLHAGSFDAFHTCLITSSDSGHTWSTPQPFRPLPRRTFVRNRVVCSWGEWVFPFQSYPVMNGNPDTSIWSDGSFKAPAVGALVTPDEGRTWLPSATATGVEWAENNIVERADGSLVMLVRADKTGCLWSSVSTDRARNWSVLEPTDIPNPGSKFRLFRLADGRIILIHNPNPSTRGANATGNQPNRNPMAMWISDDDMKSWGYKRNLTDFPGSHSYPDGFVDEAEGYVHFAYDYNRHDLIYWAAAIPRRCR